MEVESLLDTKSKTPDNKRKRNEPPAAPKKKTRRMPDSDDEMEAKTIHLTPPHSPKPEETTEAQSPVLVAKCRFDQKTQSGCVCQFHAHYKFPEADIPRLVNELVDSLPKHYDGPNETPKDDFGIILSTTYSATTLESIQAAMDRAERLMTEIQRQDWKQAQAKAFVEFAKNWK
jgi:hypothetical protein